MAASLPCLGAATVPAAARGSSHTPHHPAPLCLQGLAATVQALLDQGESLRPALDAEVEAYALRLRLLVQRKAAELQGALPGGMSDVGSGGWAGGRAGSGAGQASWWSRGVLFPWSMQHKATAATHAGSTGSN